MKGKCDVLFFSAHPDDVEFGMGGTYLKLCKGYKAAHVILTKGEAGTHGTPEIREKEALEAGECAGTTVEFLGFKDNHIEDSAENAKRIAAVIRKYKPKIIFSPYHSIQGSHKDGVAHPDHVALGRLVLKAARFARFRNASISGEHHLVESIYYYMLPRYLEPSILVDVSDVIDELKELWSKHKSQMKLGDGKIAEMLLHQRHIVGRAHKMGYAEQFKTDEPLKLDFRDFLRV